MLRGELNVWEVMHLLKVRGQSAVTRVCIYALLPRPCAGALSMQSTPFFRGRCGSTLRSMATEARKAPSSGEGGGSVLGMETSLFLHWLACISGSKRIVFYLKHKRLTQGFSITRQFFKKKEQYPWEVQGTHSKWQSSRYFPAVHKNQKGAHPH